MLAGRVPFPGGDVQQRWERHRSDTPQPLEQLNPAVPKVLATLVGRMMAKKPADRFADATQLAAAIAPLVKQFGSGAEASAPPAPRVKLDNWLAANGELLAPPAPGSAAPEPIVLAHRGVDAPVATQRSRTRHKHLPLVIGCIVALLVVGGAAAFLLLSGVRAPQSSGSLAAVPQTTAPRQASRGHGTARSGYRCRTAGRWQRSGGPRCRARGAPLARATSPGNLLPRRPLWGSTPRCGPRRRTAPRSS